MIRLIKSKV